MPATPPDLLGRSPSFPVDLTPTDRTCWRRCLVPETEILSPRWDYLRQLPSMHVVGNTFRSQTTSLYEVAIAETSIPWLRMHQIPFQSSTLDSDLTALYDMCYIPNAIAGIDSKPGRGLDRYYRHYTVDWTMLLYIERAILARDLRRLTPRTLHRLADCRRLVSLCLGSHVHGVDQEDWIEHLTADIHTCDMNALSLVRGLVEAAGGIFDCSQHQFDMGQSANNNLAQLGRLVGLVFPEPVVLEGFCVARTRLTLWNLFGLQTPEDHDDLDWLLTRLPRYVPVGYSDALYRALPAKLVGSLLVQTVHGATCFLATVARQTPRLTHSRNRLLLLFCHVSLTNDDDPALFTWMVSADGLSVYRQLCAEVYISQTSENIALHLVALVLFGQAAGHNQACAVSGHSLLLDLLHLHREHDEAVAPARLWLLMACSVLRASNCPTVALVWLEVAIDRATAGQVSDDADWLLDEYWRPRLLGQGHLDVWEQMQNEWAPFKAD